MENEYLKNFITTIFPHKVAKGTIGSDALLNLLSLQALYPNMDSDNIVKIAIFTYKNKIDIQNLTRLNDIENFGYKINKDKKSDYFLEVKEYSEFLENTKKDYIFNIKSTTLPYHLSYFGKLKDFRISSVFLEQLKKNFWHKTGFNLNSCNDNISIDFKNKIINYPKNEDQKEEVKNLISASVIFAICKENENIYNKIQSNEDIKKNVIFDSKLIASAILKTVGINKDSWFSPKFKKDYIWGDNNLNIQKKMLALTSFISKTVKNLDIQKTVLEFNEEQKLQDKIKYIEKVIYSKNNYGFGRISDDELQNLKNKTLNEIVSDESKNIMILESLGIDYKIKGNKIELFNLEDHTKDKKSPDGTLNFYNGVYIYNSFVSDSKGTIVKLVEEKNGCDFKIALDFCIEASNSINYFKEALKENAVKNSNKKIDKSVNKKDLYAQKLIDSNMLTEDEYYSIGNMTIEDMAKLEVIINKRKEIQEEHSFRENNKNYGLNRENTLKTRVLKYENLNENLVGNSPAEIYLKDKRGYTNIPKELKLITGLGISDNDKEYTVHGVGFINNYGGSDLKIIDNFRYGDAQSFGKKDITVFNKNLLESEKHLKQRKFCIFESQWDYVAAYQDKDFKKDLDNSITIILNGATNGINKTIDLINNNKLESTAILLFDQSDETSQKTMMQIDMGTSGITDGKYLKTASTKGNGKIFRLSYNNEEINNKMDLNDVLKECNRTGKKFSVLERLVNQKITPADPSMKSSTQKIY